MRTHLLIWTLVGVPGLLFATLSVVSAFPPHTSAWLSRRGLGSDTEATEYYTTTVAPLTLDLWKDAYGFSGSNDTAAIYYNAGDLGFGREMHCRKNVADVACYVVNHGLGPAGPVQPSIADAIANQNNLATVAMVYHNAQNGNPNDVTFYIYDPPGTLTTSVALDGEGNKFVPNMCLACHGGSYNPTSHTTSGANFLPFDTESFRYSSQPGYTLADQQENFRKLNELVRYTNPTPSITELIDGWYAATGGVSTPGSTPDNNFVPVSYTNSITNTNLYNNVFKPNCRSCHIAQTSYSFSEPAQLLGSARFPVFRSFDMPHAELTSHNFWNSPAPAYLANSGLWSYRVTRLDDPMPDGCNPGDCSLREAILAANSGPTAPSIITFDVDGVFTLTRSGNDDDGLLGDLDITSVVTDVILLGNGPELTIIDGGGIDRVFHIVGGAEAVIQNVTIQNGQVSNWGGGIYNDGGRLTLNNSVVKDNAATAPSTTNISTDVPKAILRTGTPVVTSTLNMPADDPARLPASASQVEKPEGWQPRSPLVDVVADGSFEAGSPNPFWDEFSLNFGTPLCTVASCGNGNGTTGPHTGTWWAWFGGTDLVESGYLTQTVVITSGAATLSFWFWIGASSGTGNDYMRVRIDGTPVFTATDTTPGYNTYTQVTLDVSAFATGGPHVLRFESESFGPTITNFSLDDVVLGIVTGRGAGIATRNNAITEINYSTLGPGNVSSDQGGGLYNENSTATLNSSTVSGNSAATGGGLYSSGSASTTITITASTLTGNYASSTGGGVSNADSSTLFVRNTIIAGNTGGGLNDCFNTATYTSQHYNLVGQNGSANGCPTTDGTTLILAGPINTALNPNLSLAPGRTPYHALVLGGPAVDAIPLGGNCTLPSYDQLNLARPEDGDANTTMKCDIGAQEVPASDTLISGLTAANDSPTELGNTTTFTASIATGFNVTYQWNFGDQSPISSLQSPTHTYAAVGTYTAIVTATNGVGSVSASTPVTITDVAIAGLSAINNSPTELGNATAFTASITSGTNVTYQWNFGDQSPISSLQSPTHTYAAVGIYTAVVTATNGVGSVSASTVVTVQQTITTALLTVTPIGAGTGTVTSTPSGISCPADCLESYALGTVVTLTAVADVGSSFTGWGGDCSGTGVCVVTLDMARNVTATFATLVVEYKLYLPLIRR